MRAELFILLAVVESYLETGHVKAARSLLREILSKARIGQEPLEGPGVSPAKQTGLESSALSALKRICEDQQSHGN
jgi:hypothetical protein